MLQTNTINKFQHFPFHLVDLRCSLAYASNSFTAVAYATSVSHATKFIHTCPVLSSNSNNSSRENLDFLTPDLQPTDNNFEPNDRLSKLALIKYENFPSEDELVAYARDVTSLDKCSSLEESFSWFVDQKGNTIDWNKDIRLFDGVQLVSRFLEKRFKMGTDEISQVKITELLEQFQEKTDITVGDLYTHVANLYNKDQDSFKSKVVAWLAYATLAKNLIRSSSAANAAASEATAAAADVSNKLSEPLGKFGNITLNEIATNMKDMKWDLLLNNAHLTINTVPVAVNFITYSSIIRGYVKYVHNRPYNPNLNAIERLAQTKIRNRNLALFVLIGAPLTLTILNTTAVRLKDMGSVNIPAHTENSNALFLIISNFYKKIPVWVKLLINLVMIFLIVLKLLGLPLPTSILDVLFNVYYLKIYTYILGLIFTIYQLVNLYLIYRFMNNNIKIPEVLPEFLINWLKQYEVFRSSKTGIKEYKNMCYIQISIYLVFVLITLFI